MSDYETKEMSSPVEVEEGASSNVDDEFRNHISSLMLNLPHISQGPRAYVNAERNGTWGQSRYLVQNDAEGSDDTLSEDYSVPNDTDDGMQQTLLRCQICDFDIVHSVKLDHLDDEHIFDPEKMVCPACDEKFEESTIRFVQNSILQKLAWRSDKYNILYGNSAMTDKTIPSWGSTNASAPRLSDIQSSASDTDSGEDSVSVYSDTSISSSRTELEGDKSDENEKEHEQEQEQEDEEVKSLRAKFVRDLVLSTMI